MSFPPATEKSAHSAQSTGSPREDPFENFPIGVYRTAPDGALLYANRALRDMLHSSSIESLFRASVAASYLDPTERDKWLEQIEREGSFSQEIQLRRYDGSVVWVLDSATAIRDSDGRTVCYEGALQDITKRRVAEEGLEKTRNRFQSMIENGSDMISIFDSQGRRIYASPSMSRALGVAESELVDHSVLEEVHPDDQPAAAEFVTWLAQHPGETKSIEFHRRTGDGEWRLLSALGKNLIDDPSVGGIVVNARDITDERELAEQVRRSHKMEAVGRLAGGIAHDFNNLLTVISSCTDFILDDKSLAAEHRADLLEVRKATERATSLTRQLLAFGRTQVLRPSTICLNDRLHDLLPMLKRLIETTIDIRIETSADLWPVRADPGQIEQVLLNLALNARDAMAEGGVLTFATENRSVAADGRRTDREYTMTPGDYVVLKVTDTGIGMDEDTQRKIFEPFFTTKEVGKGTGLGLATAYGIVKQSGGYIQVESALSKGTEFEIFLPRSADAAPEKAQTQAAPAGAPARGTILVVEDEAAVRQALQRVLIAQGYFVFTASNGREAIELFAQRKDEIDLLITDLVMPAMSGQMLAKTCCFLRSGLKVIYLSGYTRDSLLSQQTFEPETVFVEKPFSRDEVLARVAQVLRS